MAVKVTAKYIGGQQVELEHGPSGGRILTDLPVDSGGKGRAFSPTDLLASSLASCILTVMAGVAERNGIEFKGAAIEIEKHMQESPRRISKFTGTIALPAGLDEKQREKLLACVKACPVGRSLHPDIKVEFKIKAEEVV
ncbi:MAG: OsmC family protein [Elusimicrobia bacterium]|nr:OsmC family protein [Elusimicrobiota bacterium]